MQSADLDFDWSTMTKTYVLSQKSHTGHSWGLNILKSRPYFKYQTLISIIFPDMPNLQDGIFILHIFGGKRRGESQCWFSNISMVLSLRSVEGLWREKDFFSIRHFSSNNILPLTWAYFFTSSLQNYDKTAGWIWTQIGGGVRNGTGKR